MTFCNEGLTLWYDTPDAPAPLSNEVDRRQGATLMVGVCPPSPSNTVAVHYSVDGQKARLLAGRHLRTDHGAGRQYFQADFPPMPSGELVRYLAVLSCAGRQAPAAATLASAGWENMSSSFRWAPAADASKTGGQLDAASKAPSVPTLDFVGRVSAKLHRPPEVIGPCPDGLRITFVVEVGSLSGAGVTATIRPGGTDSMIIRRDGVGVVRLRATIEMDDGALIAADYEGFFELGEGGYERALAGNFPAQPQLVLAPRFYTAASKYLWMNRRQFIGVGHVTMSKLLVQYDLYAVGVAMSTGGGAS